MAVPPNVQRPDQIGKTMTADWDRVGLEYDKWVDHVRAKFEASADPAATFSLLWIVAAVVVVAVAGIFLLRRATGEPG